MINETMKKPYFPVLEAEIAKNGIKKKDIAKALGIKDRTLSLKLTGKTEFVLSEIMYIRSLFPECSVDELFACDKKIK